MSAVDWLVLVVKCWTGKLIRVNTSQVNGEVRMISTAGGETNQVREHLLPSLAAKPAGLEVRCSGEELHVNSLLTRL